MATSMPSCRSKSPPRVDNTQTIRLTCARNLEVEVVSELRGKLLGERYVSAMTRSGPISVELKAWVESFLDMHLVESYCGTEAGFVLVDGRGVGRL